MNRTLAKTAAPSQSPTQKMPQAFFASNLAIGQEGTPNKRTRTGERVTGTNAKWRRPNKIPTLRKMLQAARAIGQLYTSFK